MDNAGTVKMKITLINLLHVFGWGTSNSFFGKKFSSDQYHVGN